MSELFEAGRIQISVSDREVKYKDGEVVTVNKFNKETGHNEPTATLIFSDIDTMKSYLTQAQIESLAVSNHLVRCQNIARNWNKEKSEKAKTNSMLKGLTDEQLAKIQALALKLQA